MRLNRRKTLIVDGNNVAFHISPNGIPQVRNLTNAINSLTASGFTPIVVVSAALRHQIDFPSILDQLMKTGWVVEAEPRTNDDLLIIREAQRLDADIVSNDRFLNWVNRFPWVPDRLRRYRLTPTGLILT